MQKTTPSIPRVLVMVVFVLSCFGLLLFLWLSFGGPVPLKPKGYQFKVPFPEATQLAIEADVRVAGVPVGKVVGKEQAPGGNRTLATLELERKYAPVAKDARATLRQKTLLGETYVELTTGNPEKAGTIKEGETLAPGRVQETVELDEILDALDPFTRQAFRTWQQSLAASVKGRDQDLNDSFGNLPTFIQSGGDLLEVLDENRGALRLLVRNTGIVFEALTEREDQLANLITNSDRVFSAISSQRESFAETWRIFPTFLDESRATFRRLQTFSGSTRPVLRDLEPAVRDLGPALRDTGALGPDLRRLFQDLDPLLEISKRSLPATAQILRGLRPLLRSLGPWLAQVNPILDWLGVNIHTLTDMLANLGVATAARTKSGDPQSPGHYLRSLNPTGAETVAMHPNRLSTNRGNAYINPLGLVGPELSASKIIANWDCNNVPGEKPATPGATGSPACRVQQPIAFQNRLQTRFPHVEPDDYSRSSAGR